MAHLRDAAQAGCERHQGDRLTGVQAMSHDPKHAEQRRANLRLAWILASAAVVFAVGFAAKIWLFSH